MSDHTHTPPADAPDGAKRQAGAFDIRTFIALLIGTYGVVLVVTGLVDRSEEALAKADGLNINLWAGLGMVVVAVLFQVWATLRPVIVPEDDGEAPGSRPEGR